MRPSCIELPTSRPGPGPASGAHSASTTTSRSADVRTSRCTQQLRARDASMCARASSLRARGASTSLLTCWTMPTWLRSSSMRRGRSTSSYIRCGRACSTWRRCISAWASGSSCTMNCASRSTRSCRSIRAGGQQDVRQREEPLLLDSPAIQQVQQE